MRQTNVPLVEITFGKGRVILSRLDLTTALLGTNPWAVNGYSPEYAQAFIKNILLWTESRTPQH